MAEFLKLVDVLGPLSAVLLIAVVFLWKAYLRERDRVFVCLKERLEIELERAREYELYTEKLQTLIQQIKEEQKNGIPKK